MQQKSKKVYLGFEFENVSSWPNVASAIWKPIISTEHTIRTENKLNYIQAMIQAQPNQFKKGKKHKKHTYIAPTAYEIILWKNLRFPASIYSFFAGSSSET